MQAHELITTYERILETTQAMLLAARAGDWETVTELEAGCRREVDRLMAMGDDTPPLSMPLRERKAQIVRKVLSDDAEIRRIAEPWMAQLDEMIGRVRTERRLSRSYGSTS